MNSSSQWTADFRAADPPRAKSLVMTIFGDAIVPHGARLWLGSLIELVEPLGVTDRLVRTSVFRLAQRAGRSRAGRARRAGTPLCPERRRVSCAATRPLAPGP